MKEKNATPICRETLAGACAEIESQAGKRMLTDDDLLLLCGQELARTYTRDEKGYA